MDNQRKDNKLEPGRFGGQLLKSRIVAEKYAPYYVKWVRRFMSEIPDRAGVTVEDRIAIFLENIAPTVEPWQLDQAEKALRLYFSHYLTLSEPDMAVTQIQPDSTGRISRTDLMDATRKLIRLRHYSHSTEQPYLRTAPTSPLDLMRTAADRKRNAGTDARAANE